MGFRIGIIIPEISGNLGNNKKYLLRKITVALININNILLSNNNKQINKYYSSKIKIHSELLLCDSS
jgi:hypothetical protein